MFEVLAKYIGGKVITILVLFGCVCGGYWFYTHPEQLESLWDVVSNFLVWLGFVLILPWAMYLVTKWVIGQDSNAAAMIMLGSYTLADAIFAIVLSGGFSGHSTFVWLILIVGFLIAGVYNFMVCDYVADRGEAM